MIQLRRVHFVVLLSVLLLAAQQTRALPQRFSARFVITAQSMEVAASHWQFTIDANGVHTYSTRSESVGIAKLLRDQQVEERTVFRLAKKRVQPVRYTYQRSGKKKRTASVDFDWVNGTGKNVINGDAWEMPLEPHMQDKLSYIMALMQAMKTTGKPPAEVVLSDGGKVKKYRLELIGKVSRDTSLGTFETVQVRRTTHDDPRVTDLWLAPKLSYLPVHIEHSEDGEVVSAAIAELEGLSP